MSTPKAEALRMIEKMPDDVDWNHIGYWVFVRARLELSFADTSGDISHDQLVRESAEWHKSVGPPMPNPTCAATTSESPVTR